MNCPHCKKPMEFDIFENDPGWFYYADDAARDNSYRLCVIIEDFFEKNKGASCRVKMMTGRIFKVEQSLLDLYEDTISNKLAPIADSTEKAHPDTL